MKPLSALIVPVAPVRPDDTLAEVARRIAEARCPLPVVDDAGRLLAVVTEDDVLRGLVPGYIAELPHSGFLRQDSPGFLRHAVRAGSRRVGDLTLPPRDVLEDGCSEAHAAELFLHSDASGLVVVSGGRPVGVLRQADLLTALVAPADGGDP